jgi:hypothetical protein
MGKIGKGEKLGALRPLIRSVICPCRFRGAPWARRLSKLANAPVKTHAVGKKHPHAAAQTGAI